MLMLIPDKENHVSKSIISPVRTTTYIVALYCLLMSTAHASIDLEAMVEPIQQKTWTFVRIIEGLIAGVAGWRMLISMSPSPIVLGIVGITLLELMKQFLK
jgi:hypothetical protein